MIDVIRWPDCTLTPHDVSASPSGEAAVNGGRTLAGKPRKIALSAGGLWAVRYENVRVRTRNQILTLQAIDAYLDGGATPIIVPRRPGRRNPDGPRDHVPHSDGTPHGDGALYAGDSSDTYLGGASSRNATTIEIDRPVTAAPLLGGEDFSLLGPDGLPEMHRAFRKLDEVIVGDRRIYTFAIRVPMRDAAPAGRELNFRNPAFVATVENPEELAAVLEGHRRASFSVEFREA